MDTHLQREIEKLKKRLLQLGGEVENALEKAINALVRLAFDEAHRVRAGDKLIDQMEVDLEEECLKVLALYQPVAIDLRYIVAVLKINGDLERIGDLASNIAKCVLFIEGQQRYEIPFDISLMGEKVSHMLRQSLNALVNLDAKIAKEVIDADEEVDEMDRQAHLVVKEAIQKNPECLECVLQILLTSRHLERIGDHATNIAEDVIYMSEGRIVRHQD